MRQILDLSEKEFVTGIAPSSQVQNGGLFHKAKGISVVRDIFLESDNVGLLQACPAPTDLTGSVITGVPISWTTRITASAQTLYINDDDAQMYTVDLATDSSPVLFDTSNSNPAAGTFYFKHSGGNEYIYQMRLTKLFRYTIAASQAEYDTGWESTMWHSPHRFLGNVYIANLKYIASLVDSGAGFTINKSALDVDPSERVNCINDDGTFLVAGLTKNLSADNLIRGQSRVIFWDTNQSSWQREWPIPDASIFSIKRVGGSMVAVTSRGVFSFTYLTPPEPVLPYLTTDKTPSPANPTQDAVDVIGNAILFGGDTRVSSFGKISPALPVAHLEPFAGFTGSVSMIAASAKTSDVFVGTAGSKLYRVKTTPTGSNATGMTAETIFIDLERWYQVGKFVLEFDDQLASGDDVSISVQGDSGTSATSWGSTTYATHGAIRSRELYGSKEARKLKVIINFNGGSPKIRNIQVWGDPIEPPTHTRS